MVYAFSCGFGCGCYCLTIGAWVLLDAVSVVLVGCVVWLGWVVCGVLVAWFDSC